MKVGLCKLCGHERPLAKAHVVPKAFYPIIPDEPLMLLSGAKNHWPKRLPVGIYDESLLCEACEAKYSRLDDEAIRILKPWPSRTQLLKDDDGFILKVDNKKAGYLIKSPDAAPLLQFFYFLLWRMAETSRPEMHLKLEAVLVEKLRLNVLSGDAADIGLRIYATRSKGKAAETVVSPRIGIIDGITIINFEFQGFQFKVASDGLGIDELALAKDRDWHILFEDFRETKLYASMRSIALRNPNPWARLKTRARNG
jgi:hypothetical protein